MNMVGGLSVGIGGASTKWKRVTNLEVNSALPPRKGRQLDRVTNWDQEGRAADGIGLGEVGAASLLRLAEARENNLP